MRRSSQRPVKSKASSPPQETLQLNSEQLLLTVTGKVETLKNLYRDDMITTSAILIRFCFEMYFLVKFYFFGSSDTDENDDPMMIIMDLLRNTLLFFLYLYLPIRLASNRAEKKVNKIIDLQSIDLNNIDMKKLQVASRALGNEIQVIRARANRKLIFSIGVSLLSWYFDGYLAKKTVEIGETLGQDVAQHFMSLTDPYFQPLQTIYAKKLSGAAFSSSELAYIESPSYWQAFDRALTTLTVVGSSLTGDDYRQSQMQMMAMSHGGDLLTQIGSFAAKPIILANLFNYFKRRYTESYITQHKQKILNCLNEFTKAYRAKWSTNGDGKSQVLLFVVDVSNIDNKELFVDELTEFCQHQHWRRMLITNSRFAISTPNITADMLNDLKAQFDRQLKLRIQIESKCTAMMANLNRLISDLISTKWQYHVERSAGMPVAGFSFNRSRVNVSLVGLVADELSTLLPSANIKVTRSEIIIKLNIISVDFKSELFKEANRRIEHKLLDSYDPPSEDSTLLSPRKSSGKSLLPLSKSRLIDFFRVAPPNRTWQHDGRIITKSDKNPSGQTRSGVWASEAILLRNRLSNVNFFAIVTPEIETKIHDETLNEEQAALITTLNNGLMVGKHGTGIKYCADETKGKFSYKAKQSKGPAGKWRLFAKTVAEDDGAVLLEFSEFKMK